LEWRRWNSYEHHPPGATQTRVAQCIFQNGSTAGRIDVANRVDGAEQNQEEHGDRHEADLGLDADAERDHEQRRQSDLRNATESP